MLPDAILTASDTSHSFSKVRNRTIAVTLSTNTETFLHFVGAVKNPHLCACSQQREIHEVVCPRACLPQPSPRPNRSLCVPSGSPPRGGRVCAGRNVCSCRSRSSTRVQRLSILPGKPATRVVSAGFPSFSGVSGSRVPWVQCHLAATPYELFWKSAISPVTFGWEGAPSESKIPR